METNLQAEKTLSPYFFVQSDDPHTDQLPLKSTAVQVNIAGVIADVTVTQSYTNTGTRPIEAIYIFPASVRAAVYGMKMTIGERTIVAEIKEKQQARREYEDAKRAGKSASLLEQQRPNVFQMNVANILPNDEIVVELRYTELLIPTDGVYEFLYPTVVGPRYSNQPEADTPRSEQWVSNPYLAKGVAPTSEFDLSLNLAAGLPVQEMVCASHATVMTYESASLANLKLDDSEKFGGNRDFILKYRLSGGQIESGLLLYRGKTENFFLLMMQPPKRFTVEQIPPREYIFILDVSGSMHGFPLGMAKMLMKELFANLRPTDLFNVLLFSFGSGLLSERSLPATPENLRKGIDLITQQSGGGGTELLPALEQALSLPREAGVSRTVVIVTDGYVDVETQTFDLIRQHLGDANLFAFGIGSGVNHFIIEGMARVGMGEPFIVTQPSEAAAKTSALRRYIQSPLLTQIRAAFSGFEVYDVEPVSIPDVLAERPVIVFGKWKGEPTGTISLRGLTGAAAYQQDFKVSDVKPLEINAALRYLWARHRITLLGDYNALRHDDERVREITTLGLTYNLLTAYTSFVAIDSEIRRKDQDVTTVKQPLPLPQGVSSYAVGSAPSVMAKMAPPMPVCAPPPTLSAFRSPMSPEPAVEGFLLESPAAFGMEAFTEELDEMKEVDELSAEEPMPIGNVTVSKITVSSGVSPMAIETTLQHLIELLSDSYQEFLQEHPTITGSVVVSFRLGKSGRAKDVKIVSTELHEKKIEKSLIKQLEKLRFSSHTERAEVIVSCTFTFASV